MACDDREPTRPRAIAGPPSRYLRRPFHLSRVRLCCRTIEEASIRLIEPQLIKPVVRPQICPGSGTLLYPPARVVVVEVRQEEICNAQGRRSILLSLYLPIRLVVGAGRGDECSVFANCYLIWRPGAYVASKWMRSSQETNVLASRAAATRKQTCMNQLQGKASSRMIGTSARKAWPRCEIASFWAGDSSAVVWVAPVGTKIGS